MNGEFPSDRSALLHLLGGLDEGEALAYFAALRSWRDEPGSLVVPPHHVPAALLSRWERVRLSVSPLERELVEAHLSGCEACREDHAFAVRFAGGVSPVRPRLRVLPWIGGGVIGAALAASLLLAVLPSDPSGPSLEPVTWVAPSFTRGVGSVVGLPSDGAPLVLVVPVGSLQSDFVRVEILDASDLVVLSREVAADEIQGGSLMLQWHSWSVGRYRCRVVDGDVVRTGEFELVP